MTRVCIVGAPDVDVRYELLSRETAREVFSTYAPTEPYENTLSVRTVSLGAAVSLCNDLNWYLVRFASDALVLEPSISADEWLSRALARAVRDEHVTPDETDRYYKIYAVENGALADPVHAMRTGGVPEIEGRDADETVVVRITEAEYDG